MRLNCFRRLLPRGSEGAIEETAQINMTVHMDHQIIKFSPYNTSYPQNYYSITQWITVPLRISQSQPLLYLLAPRHRSPTAQTNRSPVQQPSFMSSSQTPQDQFDDGNTPRVVRKNDLEELIEVLDKLLQFRWTTHKFLETITRYREHNRVRRAYGQFKTYAY